MVDGEDSLADKITRAADTALGISKSKDGKGSVWYMDAGGNIIAFCASSLTGGEHAVIRPPPPAA